MSCRVEGGGDWKGVCLVHYSGGIGKGCVLYSTAGELERTVSCTIQLGNWKGLCLVQYSWGIGNDCVLYSTAEELERRL